MSFGWKSIAPIPSPNLAHLTLLWPSLDVQCLYNFCQFIQKICILLSRNLDFGKLKNRYQVTDAAHEDAGAHVVEPDLDDVKTNTNL